MQELVASNANLARASGPSSSPFFRAANQNAHRRGERDAQELAGMDPALIVYTQELSFFYKRKRQGLGFVLAQAKSGWVKNLLSSGRVQPKRKYLRVVGKIRISCKDSPLPFNCDST